MKPLTKQLPGVGQGSRSDISTAGSRADQIGDQIAKAARAQDWLRHLQNTLKQSPRDVSLPTPEAVNQRIGPLMTASPSERLDGHIAALLDPYFDKDTPQAVKRLQVLDWQDALSGYPEWAIVAARRWWIGADNPHRHRRPLPGDIAARCDQITRPIRDAARIVEGLHRERAKLLAEDEREAQPRLTPERAAEIMREVNGGQASDPEPEQERDGWQALRDAGISPPC